MKYLLLLLLAGDTGHEKTNDAIRQEISRRENY